MIVVALVIILRQASEGPITMMLVFLVILSCILCTVLCWPVGLRRHACWLFRSASLIVKWNGLQSIEVHPVVQVRMLALIRLVVLSVLCIVLIRLLTTLSALITRVLVLVSMIFT